MSRKDVIEETEKARTDTAADTGTDEKAKEKADAEAEAEALRRRTRSALQGALIFLMLSAAVIIMAVSTQIPVLQIYGIYMRPTLDAGDIAVCIHTSKFEPGDLIAFRLDNKILVRRVIAMGGDEVTVDEDGVVTVNGKELEEPYVEKKALGQCNISFPYTVPGGRVFVLGDSREKAADSRNSAVGCIDTGEAEGKVVFRLWPALGIGPM